VERIPNIDNIVKGSVMPSIFPRDQPHSRRTVTLLQTLSLSALFAGLSALSINAQAAEPADATTATAATATTASTLSPQIIDLRAMTDAQIGPIIPHLGTLRSKTLVSTPNGTIVIQAGDAPKHIHETADEIQYVISGTGTFWLGDTPRKIHPGDLIIIPKGMAHAGSHASSGHFVAIAIKLPPQAAGDIHIVK